MLMMVAHVVLLVFFFFQVERSGISHAAGLLEQGKDLSGISSKQRQVLIQPEPRDILFLTIKELGSHGQKAQDAVITPPNVAFLQNGRNLEDLALDYPNKKPDRFDPSEFYAGVTSNSQKNNGLSKREDDGVINGLSPVSRSEKVFALQPELDVHNNIHSKRLTGFGLGLQAEAYPRRRRSWLWNQFFVIEEYKGPEPVLIGRVSMDE